MRFTWMIKIGILRRLVLRLTDYDRYARALTLALALCGCVDNEIQGVSTQLRVTSSTNTTPLAPNSTLDLYFQAIDDKQQGVADQKVEVTITDISRLEFQDFPALSWRVIMTDRQESVGNMELYGAAAVHLVVPQTASPGPVAVIGSLAGDRSAQPKTRWQNFEIAATNADSGTPDVDASTAMGGTE